jgi:hypothetical protein
MLMRWLETENKIKKVEKKSWGRWRKAIQGGRRGQSTGVKLKQAPYHLRYVRPLFSSF